jgi:hypothetical protein
MGQGYFYTLSAIAQSFAAIIALDAIFVVFKLQHIQNTIENLFVQVRRLRVRDLNNDAHDTISERGYERDVEGLTEEELSTWLQNGKIASNLPRIELKKRALKSAMNNVCRHRRRTMNWFHITLMFDSLTILASLVLLPWGSTWRPCLHYVVIILILILSCIALISTMHAITITIGYRGFAFMNNIFSSLSKRAWLTKYANKLFGTEMYD